jgi:isocitrate/isopropylmalate dehydrogenase
VHGSAPKYAGKNVANPLGAILSAQMMLDHLGFADAAAAIERSVVSCLKQGRTTRDLGGGLSTSEVGDSVCREIERPAG